MDQTGIVVLVIICVIFVYLMISSPKHKTYDNSTKILVPQKETSARPIGNNLITASPTPSDPIRNPDSLVENAVFLGDYDYDYEYPWYYPDWPLSWDGYDGGNYYFDKYHHYPGYPVYHAFNRGHGGFHGGNIGRGHSGFHGGSGHGGGGFHGGGGHGGGGHGGGGHGGGGHR